MTINGSTGSRFVDFVTELPIEILPSIMYYFPLKDLFDFFTVSKTWKIRLIGCYSLWSDISISTSTTLKMITKNVLDAITWQMVQLRIVDLQWYLRPTLFRRILEQFKQNQFETLERLELNKCSIPEGHYHLDFHILPAVANTLRYLKLISVSTGFGILFFEDVLKQCPKLEGFWFDTKSVQFRPRADDGKITSTKAVALKELVINGKDIPDSLVEHIVNLCPNLTSISIKTCSYTALDIILQHYNYQLEYLVYNIFNNDLPARSGFSSMAPYGWNPLEYKSKNGGTNSNNNKGPIAINNKLMKSQQNNKEKEGKLRYLAIHQFEENNILPLLYRNADVLQEVHVSRSMAIQHWDNNYVREAAFASIPRLSSLQVLNISSCSNQLRTITFLLSRISPSVTLHSLYLDSCDLMTYDSPIIISSIKQLTNLRGLYLKNRTKIRNKDLLELLQHFQHQLKTIWVSGRKTQLDNRILYAIAKILTLEEVYWTQSRRYKIDRYTLRHFYKILLKYNTGLRLIHFERGMMLTSRWNDEPFFDSLALVPSLEKLVFDEVYLYHITEDIFGRWRPFIYENVTQECFATFPSKIKIEIFSKLKIKKK